MAINLGIVVTGANKAELRFERFPAEARDRILAIVARQTQSLAAKIMSMVRRKTGKLLSEIKTQVFSDNPNRIVGRVVVAADGKRDAIKAAALEYGAHADLEVAAHQMKLDHVFSHRRSSSIDAFVKAHNRKIDIAALRYLRGPSEAMRGETIAAIQAAVDAAVSVGDD